MDTSLCCGHPTPSTYYYRRRDWPQGRVKRHALCDACAATLRSDGRFVVMWVLREDRSQPLPEGEEDERVRGT